MSAENIEDNMKEWLLAELRKAYFEARSGKRKTRDEFEFELNEFQNIIRLRDEILAREYHPSRGIAFVIDKPVIREIFAAPFRDRVVYHFLYNMVAEWWDRRFIEDSYSCRKGKGTLFGIKRLAHHINSVSENNTKRAYVIKLDLQGYFMSLSRRGLFRRVNWGLDRQFPEGGWLKDTCRYLWREVIFDDPIIGVKKRGGEEDWAKLPKTKSLFAQEPGKGIVIGNLSSQLLSNIYLDMLDRFVRYELGYKHYGRYVDDFFFIVKEEEFEQAKIDIGAIDQFLKELGLVLHPKKRYVQEVGKGVEYLGAMVFPKIITPGRRIKHNFYVAMEEFLLGVKDLDTIVSYFGQMRHMNSGKVERKILSMV